MAKVRNVNTGQVVEVPAELQYWTPDHQGYSPELAELARQKKKKLWQPKPWWQWAQWEPVSDDTPLSPAKPSAPAPDAGVKGRNGVR